MCCSASRCQANNLSFNTRKQLSLYVIDVLPACPRISPIDTIYSQFDGAFGICCIQLFLSISGSAAAGTPLHTHWLPLTVVSNCLHSLTAHSLLNRIKELNLFSLISAQSWQTLFSGWLRVNQEVLSICNSNVFKYILKKISYFMESEEMLEIQAVVFQCHWSSKFCLLLFIFTPDLMNI